MGYVVKNRELGSEPDEAEGIRKIFDIFLMTKSPTEMAKMLPRMGMLSKQRTTKNGRVIVGKALDKSGLYKILQNPIYIGKIKHKDQIYEGRHPAIIDMDTWNKVRAIMKENTINRGAITRKKTKAILMGFLKYGDCGRVSAKSTPPICHGYCVLINSLHRSKKPSWLTVSHAS